ncbi:VOC family protein [Chromobacterium vaccinii]|uniref:VOC family protein n=1 Tax=Chromobacterium vaccinii TaxID=1108595 RepID=UPI003C71A918
MEIRRIIANFDVDDPGRVDVFYRDVLGLELVMDHGWIRTYASGATMQPQISFASEGGSGTPVPALSVEVDDLEQALARVRDAGIAVEYGPASEPWGVRRFFIRDPLGKPINILQHE